MTGARGPADWPNRFTGVPFADLGRTRAGCDCWGLVRLVYAEVLGIALPSYAGGYVSAEERAGVAALLDAADDSGPWVCVTREGWPIAAFDVLVFRRGGLRAHVGVAIDDARMLHIEGEDQAKVVRFLDPRWCSRLDGAWRFAPGLEVGS